ncbi:hypothetical protein Naga_100421g5 [Nannochloropsis gaditana]|uniref:Uncharacterized protein n=1 Tax=Nannochloropsis gaditana TaxID=72520 RepID=W7TSR5_9STRA|nr:hypothetical protein Naga_100421g5 [Nannochloropsis gaditana]
MAAAILRIYLFAMWVPWRRRINTAYPSCRVRSSFYSPPSSVTAEAHQETGLTPTCISNRSNKTSVLRRTTPSLSSALAQAGICAKALLKSCISRHSAPRSAVSRSTSHPSVPSLSACPNAARRAADRGSIRTCGETTFAGSASSGLLAPTSPSLASVRDPSSPASTAPPSSSPSSFSASDKKSAREEEEVECLMLGLASNSSPFPFPSPSSSSSFTSSSSTSSSFSPFPSPSSSSSGSLLCKL